MPVRTSFGPLQRPVTYLFVDAGHLKPNFAATTKAWLGTQPELDVSTLHTIFKATKIFYYDSIDDVPGVDELPDALELRIRQQEAALREINAIQNVHVRYGSVTGRDRRKRRQKEVDILIAVDMMNHAFRQNMDRAVLLAGDRDFTPLVETLVQYGLTIEVAGDSRFTSDVLRQAADNFQPLALRDYIRMIDQPSRLNNPPFPEFVAQKAPVPVDAAPIASGSIGKSTVQVFTTRYGLVVEFKYPNRVSHVEVTSQYALERLKLYITLQHGDASWFQLPDATYFS